MEAHTEQASKQDDGYELFRRAIVERDEDAWKDVVSRYRPLLITWANHCDARRQTGECSGDIADRAMARAWSAISPAQFTNFPSLAPIMAYLRACVSAVVIDLARAQTSRERTMQKLAVDPVVTPEQIVLQKLAREDLWQLVNSLATTHEERVVLNESFVLNLPPRVILARHPELFASVIAIYTAKRNLLNRLHRNSDLQQLRESLYSA